MLQRAFQEGGGAWVSWDEEALDPGWMLPLTVMCQAFSMFIMTSAEADLYRHERPLPLTELYSPSAPSLGLLSLLRFAIWQVSPIM